MEVSTPLNQHTMRRNRAADTGRLRFGFLLPCRRSIVSRAMAHLIRPALGVFLIELNLDAPEGRI